MTALPDRGIETDAELAVAAAGGDRAAFASIYDRYADRLYDYCLGVVRDRDAAADCVQDAFCTAAAQLPTLRDPARLRSWLYAIVRNEGLRRIRQRSRERVTDELPDRASGDAGADTLAGRRELAALVAEAAGGLSDRDRSVLELTYYHGLDGRELAETLGVSPDSATKMVSRLRDTVERSLGALLVARRAARGTDRCQALAEILTGWDGRFTMLMRKRISRHIESCALCDEERGRLVSPSALLAGAPVFIPAPAALRDVTLGKIKLTGADSSLSAARDGRAASRHEAAQRPPRIARPAQSVAEQRRRPDTAGDRLRHVAAMAGVMAGAMALVVGSAMLWLYRSSGPTADTVTPVDPVPVRLTTTGPSALPSAPPSAQPKRPASGTSNAPPVIPGTASIISSAPITTAASAAPSQPPPVSAEPSTAAPPVTSVPAATSVPAPAISQPVPQPSPAYPASPSVLQPQPTAVKPVVPQLSSAQPTFPAPAVTSVRRLPVMVQPSAVPPAAASPTPAAPVPTVLPPR